MKISRYTGAGALLAAIAAHPASAQQDGPDIIVRSQLLQPAAGLMNDHMHEGGEIMVALRFERSEFDGANRTGTDRIADAAILAAGFTTRAQSMTMDMAMLDLMYAPNDNLTLMVMPQYMWHRMDMVGIDPSAGTGSHGGHGGGGGHAGHHGGAIPFGATHSHSTEGFGDTLASASYRLAREPGFGAHVTLGLWVPTGSVDKRNADGTFVHYGMQPGSGTWDIEPAATVRGHSGTIGWGAQAAYRWRAEESNESGFRFGDRARVTGWGSYLLAAGLGVVGRVEYAHEGRIEGHYNGPHLHAAPPDRQENYGGEIVTGAIGLNWLLPVGNGHRPQLGAEFAVPLYQDVNGIQLPQDSRLSLSLSQTF